MPWVGVCLTLLGVSLMVISSVATSKYREFQFFMLLGVPFLLASWLIHPLLIVTNNLYLLSSIYWSTSANIIIGANAILGFALTLSGSAMGVWKSQADLKRIMHVSH